ncbi:MULTISPECIES: ABC transporter substrate-binding protein [unclassified Streptococcus]|uniref:ABC transporter substrate-binding protein n=1 Tax=unclassified Streptococcus TaxID=2608887 RepID=UPI00107202B8|nr:MULTISPECIES: extracellular solute-binding protein [unclassified Streptococcus]MBF0788093.1 extracellular solute-binding protein [Streptococcus sp. 19428wC2_LYSM12]MCQ9212583.1 extracellular solute-binding protein [Streptococcus sp. B01]MCQ9213922.1 extracellular solute-binding protein [Streptococcus sp. O1]TFV04853.1 extracellular solute-binding protein [Streptococcus sp. LYSM12]
MLKRTFFITLTALALAGCSNNDSTDKSVEDLNGVSLEELVVKAKEEGEVNSLGMPDSWANWKETWEDIYETYNIKHSDTDMSSAEELAKFESEKKNASGDIGDVGIAFGSLAVERDLVVGYKTSYFDDIPDWAKDKDGKWIIGYTGTMAFMSDKKTVKNAPKSWEDIKNGDFKVTIGDVEKANQSQFAVLAASYAFGGDEKNLQPGIDFFKKLAEEGRLVTTSPDLATIEKGEHEVVLIWDFNALNYRDQIDKSRFDVTIPEDKSVISGYATIINKHAKNPHAAALAREFILSDEGQDNLAKGYAKPIRTNANISDEAKNKLLPESMYKNVTPVKDSEAWNETLKELPQKWQEEISSLIQ